MAKSRLLLDIEKGAARVDEKELESIFEILAKELVKRGTKQLLADGFTQDDKIIITLEKAERYLPQIKPGSLPLKYGDSVMVLGNGFYAGLKGRVIAYAKTQNEHPERENYQVSLMGVTGKGEETTFSVWFEPGELIKNHN